jgi:hypothetical protein
MTSTIPNPSVTRTALTFLSFTAPTTAGGTPVAAIPGTPQTPSTQHHTAQPLLWSPLQQQASPVQTPHPSAIALLNNGELHQLLTITFGILNQGRLSLPQGISQLTAKHDVYNNARFEQNACMGLS